MVTLIGTWHMGFFKTLVTEKNVYFLFVYKKFRSLHVPGARKHTYGKAYKAKPERSEGVRKGQKIMKTEQIEVYRYGVRPLMFTERSERLKQRHERPNQEQIETCKQWLQEYASKPKSKGTGYSSYFLKHRVEACYGSRERPCYVTNGSMIAAAIELGYRVERRDPRDINVWIYAVLEPKSLVGRGSMMLAIDRQQSALYGGVE